MRVEDFRPIAPIKAFDVRVLIGLSRLNVVNRRPVCGAPIHEGLRGKFWALSTRIAEGQPWIATSSSSVRVTRLLGNERPIAISKPCGLPSSIMVSKRTRRPL